MRVLLAAKATVNTQEKVGFVVQTHSHNMLFTLFSSYVQSGETPLWAASFYGHQKCMELLIDAGANVDVPKEVSVSSCTHISVVLCCWSIKHHAELYTPEEVRQARCSSSN